MTVRRLGRLHSRFVANSANLAASSAISSLLALSLLAVLGRSYGVDGLAAYVRSAAFAALVAPFVTLGSSAILIRRVAQDAQEARSDIVFVFLMRSTLGGMAILLVFMAPVSLTTKLLVTNGILSGLVDVGLAALRGQNRFTASGVALVAYRSSQVLCALLVSKTASIQSFALAASGASIACSGVVLIWALRRLPKGVDHPSLRIQTGLFLLPGYRLAFASLFEGGVTRADVLLAGLVLSANHNAAFAAAASINMGVVSLLYSVVHVALPKFAVSGLDGVVGYVQKVALGLGGAVTLLVMGASSGIVALVVGVDGERQTIRICVVIFSVGFPAVLAGRLWQTALVAVGDESSVLRNQVFAATSVIAGVILLGSRFGAAGAAVGSAGGDVVLAVVARRRVAARVCGRSELPRRSDPRRGWRSLRRRG